MKPPFLLFVVSAVHALAPHSQCSGSTPSPAPSLILSPTLSPTPSQSPLPSSNPTSPTPIDLICFPNGGQVVFDEELIYWFANVFCEIHGDDNILGGQRIVDTYESTTLQGKVYKFVFQIETEAGCSLGGSLNTYLEGYSQLEPSDDAIITSRCGNLFSYPAQYCDSNAAGGSLIFGMGDCAQIWVTAEDLS